jgi:hypothetical protein
MVHVLLFVAVIGGAGVPSDDFPLRRFLENNFDASHGGAIDT